MEHSEELHPFVVWLHGGWFVGGDALEHGVTSGEFAAGVHGVIVLSPQYRLALLGFFFLEEFQNMGLLIFPKYGLHFTCVIGTDSTKWRP